MEKTFLDHLFEPSQDGLERKRPKALCKITRQDGAVGWGCLIYEPKVQDPNWSEYFIITSCELVSKEDFDAEKYQVELTKSNSKSNCFQLGSIIKKSPFYDTSGLVVIFVDSESSVLNHGRSGCKHCSVLKDLEPKIGVKGGKPLFCFIESNRYKYIHGKLVPENDGSRLPSPAECCSTVLLEEDERNAKAVGILNFVVNELQLIRDPVWFKKSKVEDILGIPDKPTIQKEEGEVDVEFTLTWLAPSASCTDVNSKYRLEWRKKPLTGSSKQQGNTDETHFKITNLEFNSEYEVKLFAFNRHGESEPEVLTFKTKTGLPGKPTIENTDLEVEKEIVLTWSSAVANSCDLSSKYRLEWRKKPFTGCTEMFQQGNIVETHFTITGLEYSSEYEVKLFAVNKQGDSEPDVRTFKTKSESTKVALTRTKKEIERNLAKMESEIKNLHVPTDSDSKDEGVFDPTELIEGISQLYKTREGWLSPFPWCEEFQFFVGDIFTRLKLVRRKKTRGDVTDKIIRMSSLLNPHEECSEPRTVLIEGKPGMGKTTYCQKCVYDWATRKQNHEDYVACMKAVLLLKCRGIKSDIWEAIDDQLLPQDLEEGVKEKFFQFIRENQSSILLMLDGLDELPSGKLPWISDLIEGRLLPKCNIVATARHEVGVKLRKFCDTLLEVKGFTEKKARKFIAKYFKEKSTLAEKLSVRISRDENLREMCANPLNTVLLCLLCEEFEGTLPENRTKLYLDMTECVLRRYRKKTELPHTNEDLTNLYKSQLKTLGSIALNGLIADKLDFDENELGEHAGDLAAFGFLSVHPGASKLRPSLHYAFLHKSFQECFAAFYICCEIQDKRITPEELVSDERYFWKLKQVLLFSCGILAEWSDEEAVAALVLSIVERIDNLDRDHRPEMKVVCEAINECERKRDDFHLQLAKCFGSNMTRKKLNFELRSQGNELILILSEAVKVNKTVTRLYLDFSEIGDTGATSIAEAIKVNQTLTTLHLRFNQISDTGATSIAEAIKVNKTLTTLLLHFNQISDTGATSIAETIKVNKTLTTFHLRFNQISDTGVTSIAEAVKVNKTLTNLDLSGDQISDVGATSIAEAIKVNKALTNLDLSRNQISDVGATSIAEAIKVNKTLINLDLSGDQISDVGATSIAEAIKVNKTLTNLDLKCNQISDAGATSIGKAIKVNKTLTNLDLSWNQISDVGATSIAEAIKVNKTLTNLDLSWNQISDVGATSFAEAIKVNKTLIGLSLYDNDIGVAGATAIAEALKVSKTLANLDLSLNQISDAGATSIAEAIKVNKALTKLILSNNDIGVAGATAFAEAIKVNKTLTNLDLSYNRISDAGATSIAEAIKVSETLTYLDLSDNQIDDAGTTSIAEALIVTRL